MPPCRASAPPESPVPAPRPTSGVLYVIRELHDGDHVRGRAREHNAIRPRDFDRAVVFIEQQDPRARAGRRPGREGFAVREGVANPFAWGVWASGALGNYSRPTQWASTQLAPLVQ